jgi:hypothetical protein
VNGIAMLNMSQYYKQARVSQEYNEIQLRANVVIFGKFIFDIFFSTTNNNFKVNWNPL